MTPDFINWNFPVVGIERFNTTLRVIRKPRKANAIGRLDSDKQATRGRIATVSRKSMSRLAFLVRETGTMFKSMLTLTYGAITPKDGREAKDHLGKMLAHLRRSHSAQYVWFIEFTKRGIPHFHLLTDHIPTVHDRFYMAETWANGVAIRWTPDGVSMDFSERVSVRNKMFLVHFHKKAWELIRDGNGAAKYVTKYATKTHQKHVPESFRNLGRVWGASSEIRADDPQWTVDVTEDELRDWLKHTLHRDLDHMEVLPKYIYLNNSGENGGE